MFTFSATDAEVARNEISRVSVARHCSWIALKNALRRAVIFEVGAHLHMAQTEELQFAQRFPMQPLEEFGILILHRGQKFAATERVRRRYRLVNQACSQRAEPSIDRLMISKRHSGTDFFDTPKICRHAQPGTIPDIRLHARRCVRPRPRSLPFRQSGFHRRSGSRRVDFIAVRSAKDLLFLAENRPPERPEPLDFLLGARDFENKILRHEAIERIEDHADRGAKQLVCRLPLSPISKW